LKPARELGSIYSGKLRLGIVKIVDVYGFQLQVSQTLLELVRQISRCHRMAPLHKVLSRADSRADKGALEIVRHFLSTLRRRSVKGQISTLCGNDYFVTIYCTRSNKCLERLADDSLTALKAIIGSGVDDITPELNGSSNRR
jgi:hypothetical protein